MANYDVFLSHNGKDKPLVEALAHLLRKHGLEPFLDKWHLIPGEPWQEALETALNESRTCAVFLGPHGLGPWENEEMRAALVGRVANRSFRVIPVLLPGSELPRKGELPPFLSRVTWVDFRKGVEDEEALNRLISGVSGRAVAPGSGDTPSAQEICPYLGLHYFDEKDAPFFFGRESFIQQLVENLRDRRFLAVIAPSGSGKSSVVRAGLIPALRKGELPGSETWPILVMTPGVRPVEELAARLVQLLPPGTSDLTKKALDLQGNLRADPRSLHTEVKLALAAHPNTIRLLVFVDQFEELFTLCHDETERKAFLDALLYACDIALGQTVIVIAMRADFYSRATAYPELADRIADKQITLTPMVESEVRQAIERPAYKAGLTFDEGLVNRIIEDFMGEPGALPLLEHTLFELWNSRQGRKLTLSAYDAIGGVRGAIAKRAEQELTKLTPAQQQTARRILLRLVQPGEGAEDTRRRALMSELSGGSEQTSTVDTVVQILTASRLLTVSRDAATGEEQIDVAHEALIRGWPRLQNWINDDRQALSIHRRLTEHTHDWLANRRDESFLYRGALLATAEEWQKKYSTDLSANERAFLQGSLDLQRRELAEKEQQRLREIDNAKELAEEAEARRQAESLRALQSERATKRFRRLSVVLAGAGLLAITAALFFVFARNDAIAARDNALIQKKNAEDANVEADEQRRAAELASQQANTAKLDAERRSREALARQLAAQAISSEEVRPFRAMLLAVEAISATQQDGVRIPAAEEALRQVLASTPSSKPLLGHDGAVVTVVYGPDGKTLASGTDKGTIRLWDMENPALEPVVLKGHDNYVSTLAFSPDSKTLASEGADNTVLVWNPENPLAEPTVLGGHEDYVTALAFSPGGKTLASGSIDGTVLLWDVANPSAEPVVLTGHEGYVSMLAFSPDGAGLASGSWDGTVRLWDVAHPLAEPVVLIGRDNVVTTLVFSPDGKTLASGSEKGNVLLWAMGNPTRDSVVLSGHVGIVTSLAFSPDGTRLASGSNDKTVRLWDMENPSVAAVVLRGHEDFVTTVTFSPDGKWLASGSIDKTLRLWEVENPGADSLVLRGHDDIVTALVFSPSGETLASGSFDSTILLWNLQNPSVEPVVLRGHEDYITTLAFSPDGKTLASGSNDNSIRLWDMENPGADSLVLRGHDDIVTALVFSPDGKTLVSESFDNTIRLWLVNSRDLSALACDTVGRNLSLTEWQQFMSYAPYHKTCEQFPPGEGTLQ